MREQSDKINAYQVELIGVRPEYGEITSEYGEYAEYDTLCVRGVREGQCTSRGNIGRGSVGAGAI